MTDINYKRYLKYKSKYLELKQSGSGGLSRSSPHTVEMLKNIKKNISFGKGFQWYKKINFDFEQLITNLKTDLTNIKSTFDQKLLDTFVESANYTRITFAKGDEDLPPKVDLKTNFMNISFISLYGHITLINKDKILSINKFIEEINKALDNNLTNMEYKQEFKEILTIFLGRYETYYNQQEEELKR